MAAYLPQTALDLIYTNVMIPYLYHLEKWFATKSHNRTERESKGVGRDILISTK